MPPLCLALGKPCLIPAQLHRLQGFAYSLSQGDPQPAPGPACKPTVQGLLPTQAREQLIILSYSCSTLHTQALYGPGSASALQGLHLAACMGLQMPLKQGGAPAASSKHVHIERPPHKMCADHSALRTESGQILHIDTRFLAAPSLMGALKTLLTCCAREGAGEVLLASRLVAPGVSGMASASDCSPTHI